MEIGTAAFIIRLLIEAFPKLAAAWGEYAAIKDPTAADWDRIWAIKRGKTYDELVHGLKPTPTINPTIGD